MMRSPGRPQTLRLAALAAAVVVLGLVFSAYLQPDLVVDLANRVWSCF